MDWFRYWALVKAESSELREQKLSKLYELIIKNARKAIEIKKLTAQSIAAHHVDSNTGHVAGIEAEQAAQRRFKAEELMRQRELLIVKVLSCVDLQNADEGGFGGGLSDPFVKVMLEQPNGGIQKFKTTVQNDTLDPVFNETFEFNSSVAQRKAWPLLKKHKEDHEATLIFQVWDYDLDANDLMGTAYLRLSQLQQHNRKHKKECTLELILNKVVAGTITFAAYSERA